MKPPRQPLTEAAALFVGFALTAALVGAGAIFLTAAKGDFRMLELGAAFSAGCVYFALAQLRTIRRVGWRRPQGDDDNGGGWGHGGSGPTGPPTAPGGGDEDWERFTAEFWTYVDSRSRETTGVS